MSNLVSASWLGALIAGVIAVLAATGFGDIRVHLATAAIVALCFAVIGNKENARLRATGASEHAIGAATARNMGLVWLWGAGVLGISYAVLLTPWREWTHFFAAFAIVGILCLLFAAALNRDADQNSEDQTLLKLGRLLTFAQLIGMLATIAGIAIDPDKSILSKIRPDWAANIVFVFGGLSLLAISAYALWHQRKNATVS